MPMQSFASIPKGFRRLFTLSFVSLVILLFQNCSNLISTSGEVANSMASAVGVEACKGDGVSDDTTCLQSALDATLGPRQVSLPSGKTYMISKRLSLSSNLTLDGNNSRIVLKIPEIMLYLSGSNIQVKNIALDYQATSGFSGVIDFARNTNSVTISGVHISGAKAIAGVHINNPGLHDITIQDSIIENTIYGILTNTTNFSSSELRVLSNHPYNLIFQRNQILNVSGDGVEINSPIFNYTPYNSGILGVAAHDIQITSNTITAPNSNSAVAGFCIGIAGANKVNVVGNSVSNCKWQFVHI